MAVTDPTLLTALGSQLAPSPPPPPPPSVLKIHRSPVQLLTPVTTKALMQPCALEEGGLKRLQQVRLEASGVAVQFAGVGVEPGSERGRETGGETRGNEGGCKRRGLGGVRRGAGGGSDAALEGLPHRIRNHTNPRTPPANTHQATRPIAHQLSPVFPPVVSSSPYLGES